jgi:hypothetical protein
MNAMSIDMDAGVTPANTSSVLGTREMCGRINENNLMDSDEDVVDGLVIDVTARDVPAYSNNGTPGDNSDDTGGIISYRYDFNYSSANLTVQAHEYNNPSVNLLARNPGSLPFDASDGTPDDNDFDYWYSAVFDFGVPPHVPEDGSGVLGRLTLTSEPLALSQVYPLTLGNNAHADQNQVYSPDATRNAFVAVNSTCDDLDSDGIPNEQDTCATTPGPASNDGCPLSGTPLPPAVGGSAGLLDSPTDAGGPAGTAWLAAISATIVSLSVAGGLLVRTFAFRRVRQ